MKELNFFTHARIKCIAIAIDGVQAGIKNEILLVATRDHRCAVWNKIGSNT